MKTALSPVMQWRIILVLLLIFVLRIVYSMHIELVPDEAYYWDWTRTLSWGYFDHPPMVAWLAAFATGLFGDTIIGIRLIPLVCSMLSVIFGLLLARKFCSYGESLLLVPLIFFGTPLCGAGTILLTPDIPLALFWSMGLYLGYRAIFEPFRGAWPLLGATIGLGLLSKYSFGLFPLALCTFLLVDIRSRRFLVRKGPWIAAVIAFVLFLPNILWNARHGWVSYLFQFHHGFNPGMHRWPRLDLFADFLLGQISVFTPLLFISLLLAIMNLLHTGHIDSKRRFLFIFFLVPFIMFAFSSLQGKVQANWPAPAYAAGIIIIAWLWDNTITYQKKYLRRFIGISVAVAAIATAVILLHAYTPLLPVSWRKDVTVQMRGWREFGVDLDRALAAIDPKDTLTICASRYQEASLISFYTPRKHHALTISLPRGNNYSLIRQEMNVKDIIFIDPLFDGNLNPQYAPVFEWSTLVKTIVLRRKGAPDVMYGIFLARMK